jgi:MFS family permease
MPTPPFWFFPNCFPSADSTNWFYSLATFSIAFLGPGSAVFGHYGDKAQNYVGNCFIDDGYFNSFHWFYLVMPASESLPLLLMLCRFGQGVGLGGEWGGAVLLAIENAPPNKRAWYGMFPQLGAPIGLLLSGGTFLILTDTMSSQDFLDYGWNSYIASSLLVVVGFYIRLK